MIVHTTHLAKILFLLLTSSTGSKLLFYSFMQSNNFEGQGLPSFSSDTVKNDIDRHIVFRLGRATKQVVATCMVPVETLVTQVKNYILDQG